MRVCVLETGQPPADMAAVFPPYLELFEALLRPALPSAAFAGSRVLDGAFPASVEAYDAYVVTGSAATAFDRLPWMVELEAFIRRAAERRRKVVGICFGHQIAAQAFGGTVERRGWGLGVRSATRTQARGWMAPDLDRYAAVVSHQDQVTVLPDGAEVLAASDFCPYEMLAIGRHVLTLQGHPEMTPAIGEALVHRRRDQLAEPDYLAALASMATAPHDREVGHWIGGFLAGCAA